MNQKKLLASMSLDLDDQWSYMKVHGDEGWEEHPSYLHIVVPFVLDLLDELNIRITFFIVGQDAAIEKNKPILRSIVERGHEIGNHSFHHESWLKTYSKEQIDLEIEKAESAIFEATGVKTECFRGPGFSWSKDLLETLMKRNYKFDASILPTYISPLMRMYYFWNSKLSKEERESRKELFGSYKEGFFPIKPFNWQFEDNKTLLEIPVTTMPVFKIPFHLSYLLYISGFSKLLMKIYLGFSLMMCKITRTEPSILLHPLDLISGDKVPQLSFFPGMDIPTDRKVQVFKSALKQIQKKFNIVPMLEYVQLSNQDKKKLKLIEVK
jgi:hypothetical protein